MPTTQNQPVAISPITTPESRPVPDPTARTLDYDRREMQWEEKLRDIKIDHLKELFKEATTERDKAVGLLQAFAARTPTTSEVALSVQSLTAQSEQRFRSIDEKLASIEKHGEQTKSESADALKTALNAQKESAAESKSTLKESIKKSEDQFINSLEKQQELITQTANSTNERILDIKSRLDRIEGQSKGMGDIWGYMIGVIGAVCTVGALVIVVLTFLNKQ